MEIVIDIPEEVYEDIMAHYREYPEEIKSAYYFERLVLNGMPLPKGHGRLIDADALEKKMCDREEELGDDRALWESSAVSVALDMFAPTIIEGSENE